MTCDDLIRFFGSTREAAAEIRYTVQAVTGWRRAGKIPLRAQAVIETVTRGKLKADRK